MRLTPQEGDMKRLIISAIVLLTAVSAYFVIQNKITSSQPSDSDQIKEVVFRGEKAVRNRDLRLLMSCISNGYKDANGLNYTVLRARLHQAFQSEDQFELNGKLTSLLIEGDTAEAVYECRVTINGQPAFSGTIDLYLKKEKIRPYLVFSSSGWKIITASGYPGWISGI